MACHGRTLLSFCGRSPTLLQRSCALACSSGAAASATTVKRTLVSEAVRSPLPDVGQSVSAIVSSAITRFGGVGPAAATCGGQRRVISPLVATSSTAGVLPTWCWSDEQQRRLLHTSSQLGALTLHQMHYRGPPKSRPRRKTKLDGKMYMRGVVLKVIIMHPKKPNSGNRKCVIVKLTNGNEEIAYIPGEGHNLQEHSQVLVENKRKKDLIGVRLRVVRGRLDCALVKKKTA